MGFVTGIIDLKSFVEDKINLCLASNNQDMMINILNNSNKKKKDTIMKGDVIKVNVCKMYTKSDKSVLLGCEIDLDNLILFK